MHNLIYNGTAQIHDVLLCPTQQYPGALDEKLPYVENFGQLWNTNPADSCLKTTKFTTFCSYVLLEICSSLCSAKAQFAGGRSIVQSHSVRVQYTHPPVARAVVQKRRDSRQTSTKPFRSKC
ncbi:hypothetical protein L596_005987 [Steinernema carpocapsae]|uniref:Uncharacterized protein n=1 Tax=Steinernema carpocapsae TaxID=34508 RepID=A0A4U8V0V2_STECR|nr:hypothetical protein L596_005987 [Steinernema carpocapsae]